MTKQETEMSWIEALGWLFFALALVIGFVFLIVGMVGVDKVSDSRDGLALGIAACWFLFAIAVKPK